MPSSREPTKYLTFPRSILQGSRGRVNVELQLLQYDNPDHRCHQGPDVTSDRHCCHRGANPWACSQPCNSTVTVCVGRYTPCIMQTNLRIEKNCSHLYAYRCMQLIYTSKLHFVVTLLLNIYEWWYTWSIHMLYTQSCGLVQGTVQVQIAWTSVLVSWMTVSKQRITINYCSTLNGR